MGPIWRAIEDAMKEIESLRRRIEALEAKPKPGRPKTVEHRADA
jgi:hypothetical protein